MKKLSLLFILFFFLSLNKSFAQFEGKIQFDNYKMESGKKVKDEDTFTLYITPDRMLLQGDKSYNIAGSLKTKGVLIRHKQKDFIFLTGDKRAMKITKAGITSFVNMFGNDASDNVKQAGANINYKKTTDTKQIKGYACNKFVFTDKDKPDEHSDVWMTKGLNINWGILAEPWGDTMKGFTKSDLPLDLIFKQGYVPVRWKHYKNDTLTTLTEATEIQKTDVARAKVQIPSDVKVISLQDYLFQQMRNQQ